MAKKRNKERKLPRKVQKDSSGLTREEKWSTLLIIVLFLILLAYFFGVRLR